MSYGVSKGTSTHSAICIDLKKVYHVTQVIHMRNWARGLQHRIHLSAVTMDPPTNGNWGITAGIQSHSPGMYYSKKGKWFASDLCVFKAGGLIDTRARASKIIVLGLDCDDAADP